MYAVIRSGGKQYKVSKDDIISVEKLTAEAGDKISLDEVLMISEKDELIIGDPIIKGATVNAEVIEQKRAKKIIVFKKKRRQNYRRKNGHQQNLTTLKIVDIKAIATKKVAVKKEKEPKEVKPKKSASAETKTKKETVKTATKTRSVKKVKTKE